MAKPAVTRSPKPEPLSRAQREMMGWFNNNHLIRVEGKYAVLTSSLQIVGMANTVLSLERKGLIEELPSSTKYGRPKFQAYRKCQQPPPETPMRDSDDLITCRRCEDQDADVHDGICLSCQGELLDMHEHQISWRTAWELEKQEKLAWKIGQNPDYVSQQLAELDKVFQSFKDDPDFIFAVATDRQTFLTRVETVYQKHPNLRPQEPTNEPQSS